MTNDDIVTRLRAKESRDNRELLDEAAEEIEALREQNRKYKDELEAAKKDNETLSHQVANLIRSRDAAIDRAKKLEQRLEEKFYGDTDLR